MQGGNLIQIRPIWHQHIKVYGKYHFNIEEARGRKGLRQSSRLKFYGSHHPVVPLDRKQLMPLSPLH
jgi:hypothetical protein